MPSRGLQVGSCVGTSADEPVEGNYFVAAYPPFSCWQEQAASTAERVLNHPNGDAAETPLGLYIHIPFCLERCQYCYYVSYADKSGEQIDAYLDALTTELSIYGALPALAGRRAAFVYFGGGTPSLLSAERLQALMDVVQSSFAWTGVAEVTFECAPKTVSKRKLRVLRNAGVTRISLGVQQFDDYVLQRSGRIHLVRDAETAYEAIRQVGFPVVNIDLMVGMPGETSESFSKSLERAISLGPESLTIYQLEIPPNTPLFHSMRGGQTNGPLPADWKTKRGRLAAAFARLQQAGYHVRSAYAAVRDPQRHAFLYQDAQYHGADLIGTGASSFSYVDGVHYQNLAAHDAYVACLRVGRLPIGRAYALSQEERLVREFILQLKLGHVDAAHFRFKFGVYIAQRFAGPIEFFAGRRWLTVDDDSVTLTREGLLRVDRLLPAFYLAKHHGRSYW